MNINNKPTIEPRTITGIFTKYIAKTLPLAFDESMSYYECLCALLEYINDKIVPDINNVNYGLGELQTLYTELQDFVNNYFDNLDVQEEINNKLDEMAQDGSLTILIKNYVDPIYEEYQNEINQNISDITALVNASTSATPLVASSTSEMTDSDRIYVNTTDGYWYYNNGTTWVQGGVYQATEIPNNSVTPIKTNFMEQLNLCPDTNWVYNYVLNYTTGNIQAVSGGSYSKEYVEIPANKTKVVNISKANGGMHVYFYNSNYEFISSISLSDMYFGAIPENSKYLRVAFSSQYGSSGYVLLFYEDYISNVNVYNEGKLKDNYINFESDKILYNMKKLNILTKGYNNAKASPNVEGNKATYTFTYTDGSVSFLGIGVNWDIKTGDELKIKLTGNYPMNNLSLYNSNPVGLITGSAYNLNTIVSINNDSAKFTITEALKNAINSNTVFINFSIPATQSSVDYNFTFEIQINDDIYYFADLVKSFGIPDTEYHALFLGDSISALGGNDGWVAKFCKLLNITGYNNVAVSGAHLTDYSDTVYDGNPVHDGPDNNHNNVLGNQVQKIIENHVSYVNPEFIFILIGTNDGITTTIEDAYNQYYNSDRTVKSLASVDRQTSAGAFRYCNEKLHNLYPNAKIIWLTPIQASNQTRDVRNVITWGDNLKLLCSISSNYCVDSEKCGINGINEISGSNGEYLIDGLHLNSNGASLLAKFNADIVRNFFN